MRAFLRHSYGGATKHYLAPRCTQLIVLSCLRAQAKKLMQFFPSITEGGDVDKFVEKVFEVLYTCDAI